MRMSHFHGYVSMPPIYTPKPIRNLAAGKGTCVDILHLDDPILSPLRAAGVIGIGIDRVLRRYLAGSDCSPVHLIYITISGRFLTRGSGAQWRLEAGDCFVSPAGEAHWVELSGRSAQAVWVHLRPHEGVSFASGSRKLPASNRLESLRNAVRNLLEESALPAASTSELRQAYASVVASVIRQEFTTSHHPVQERFKSRISALRQAIRQTPAREWSVELAAREVGLSRAHFYRITMDYFGLTPIDLIVRARMQAAMEYLSRESWPLSEVAEQVGYSSEYSFSNAFNRVFGQRPGRFRSGLASPTSRL